MKDATGAEILMAIGASEVYLSVDGIDRLAINALTAELLGHALIAAAAAMRGDTPARPE